MLSKTIDEWCNKVLIIDDGRQELFRACWKAAQLALVQQLLGKSETDFEVKYVLSWKDLGGNVDSSLFDTYEEALKYANDNKTVLPVITQKDY